MVTFRKHEFFIFPSYRNVHGNTRLCFGNMFSCCFRWRNKTECRRKYEVTCRKHFIFLFLLMYPDLEGRKYNVLFQKHFFFVSACAVVVFFLPFSLLQDRLICCDRAFSITYTRLILFVCEICASLLLCKITHTLQSMDRWHIIDFCYLKSTSSSNIVLVIWAKCAYNSFLNKWTSIKYFS